MSAKTRAQFSGDADVQRFIDFHFVGVGRRAVFEHDLHIADRVDRTGVEIVDEAVGPHRAALEANLHVAFSGDRAALFVVDQLIGFEQDALFRLRGGRRWRRGRRQHLGKRRLRGHAAASAVASAANAIGVRSVERSSPPNGPFVPLCDPRFYLTAPLRGRPALDAALGSHEGRACGASAVFQKRHHRQGDERARQKARSRPPPQQEPSGVMAKAPASWAVEEQEEPHTHPQRRPIGPSCPSRCQLQRKRRAERRPSPPAAAGRPAGSAISVRSGLAQSQPRARRNEARASFQNESVAGATKRSIISLWRQAMVGMASVCLALGRSARHRFDKIAQLPEAGPQLGGFGPDAAREAQALVLHLEEHEGRVLQPHAAVVDAVGMNDDLAIADRPGESKRRWRGDVAAFSESAPAFSISKL